MNDKRAGDPENSRRVALTEVQRRVMMTALLRKPSALIMARDQLQPDNFGEYDAVCSLLWRIALQHYDEFGKLPSKEEFYSCLEGELAQDYDLLTDGELVEASSLLETIFLVDTDEINDGLALKYVCRHLEDRVAAHARTCMEPGFIPGDLEAFFSNLRDDAGRARSVRMNCANKPFPAGWRFGDETFCELRATGINFLDRFLGGGHSPGEVCLLLGGMGVCKTTLMVQLSVAAAINHQASWLKNKRRGPLGFVYYFTYEEPHKLIRSRALSCLARVDKPTVYRNNPSELSTSDALKDYELALFANDLRAGKRIRGERERIDLAMRQLNRNWRLVDMGTGTDHPGVGCGMVPEIAAVVRRSLMTEKTDTIEPSCALIVVDYIGAAVDKYILAKGMSYDGNLRHLLRGFPRCAKEQLAGPFECPVWLAHQLSGAVNQMPPGVLPGISDSAECKTIAESADFLFVIGAKTRNMLAAMGVRKARRSPPKDTAIVRINGDLARVDDTAGFMLDESAKEIVESSSVRKIDRPNDLVMTADEQARAYGRDSDDDQGIPLRSRRFTRGGRHESA